MSVSKRFEEEAVSTTFGLTSIIEYPKGQYGAGDIDSGPVILGVRFSGTIVSVGTSSVLDEFELAEQQYKAINAFGFGCKSEDEKKYVFGLMPIADAFIAWGRATELHKRSQKRNYSNTWQNKFHCMSFH